MQIRHPSGRKMGANGKEPVTARSGRAANTAASGKQREQRESGLRQRLVQPVALVAPEFPQVSGPDIELIAKCPVTLRLQRTKAQAVYVAGTFNAWGLNVTALKRVANDIWETELFLEPGEYPYRFVIDGHWTNDPSATQFAANGFGELNSILVVR